MDVCGMKTLYFHPKKVLSNVGCIKGSGNGQAGIGLKLSNLGLDNWHPSGKFYKTFFDVITLISV